MHLDYSEEKPKRGDEEDDIVIIHEKAKRRGALPLWQLTRVPSWLVAFIILWIVVAIEISQDVSYSRAFSYIKDGIPLTIALAFAAYAAALLVGLLAGIVRASRPQPFIRPWWRFPGRNLSRTLHYVVYNLVSFYVEFMRGIPALVFLLVAGFVLVPILRDAINTTLLPLVRGLFNDPEIPNLVWRARDEGTAIIGLALIYGAYLAEIFRAGIQSVGKGQIEAARSLGMTYIQVMRYIVIPQAVRTVLPPLGNDFIAMIKDTSLLTILGVNEITQLSRKWVGTTFEYTQTFLVLSFIYLTMTIFGSLLVQAMERYLRQHER